MNSATSIIIDYVLPDRRHSEGIQKAPLASYTLAVLLAQTPKEIMGCEVIARVHDEQAHGPYVPGDARPDILCLTYMTTGAPRAYYLSDEAMRTPSHEGALIKVVHGGVHATSLPREALLHSNIVVRGEITEDFQHRILVRAFNMDPSERTILRLAEPPAYLRRPRADWSWMNRKDYILAPVIQTSVGCPFNCDFCSVTEVFGAGMRAVDEGDVRADLEQLPRKSLIAIIDDNFLQGTTDRHIEHCLRIASLLHEFGLRWVTEVTVRTLIDAQIRLAEQRPGFDLLEYFAECGCRGLFFGIETLDETGAGLKKTRNLDETISLIRRCQANGIGVLGAFVLGVGKDETPDYARRLLEFAVEKCRLDFAQFSINTPMPGARNFVTGVRDGRIFNFDWELYDAEHCVMSHPRMAPEEIESTHRWLYEEFYSHRSLRARYDLLPLLLLNRNVWRRAFVGIPGNLILHRANRSWNDRLDNARSRPVIARPHATVLEHVSEALGANPDKPGDLFNLRRKDNVSVSIGQH